MFQNSLRSPGALETYHYLLALSKGAGKTVCDVFASTEVGMDGQLVPNPFIGRVRSWLLAARPGIVHGGGMVEFLKRGEALFINRTITASLPNLDDEQLLWDLLADGTNFLLAGAVFVGLFNDAVAGSKSYLVLVDPVTQAITRVTADPIQLIVQTLFQRAAVAGVEIFPGMMGPIEEPNVIIHSILGGSLSKWVLWNMAVGKDVSLGKLFIAEYVHGDPVNTDLPYRRGLGISPMMMCVLMRCPFSAFSRFFRARIMYERVYRWLWTISELQLFYVGDFAAQMETTVWWRDTAIGMQHGQENAAAVTPEMRARVAAMADSFRENQQTFAYAFARMYPTAYMPYSYLTLHTPVRHVELEDGTIVDAEQMAAQHIDVVYARVSGKPHATPWVFKHGDDLFETHQIPFGTPAPGQPPFRAVTRIMPAVKRSVATALLSFERLGLAPPEGQLRGPNVGHMDVCDTMLELLDRPTMLDIHDANRVDVYDMFHG